MRFSFNKIRIAVWARIAPFVRRVGPVKLLAAVAILIVSAVTLINVALRGDEAGVETRVPLVSVASIRELSSERGSLPVLGRVRSVAEATIRTESQGQVVRVNYELGDFVFAGAVIAELENGTERAHMRQSEALLNQLLQGVAREEIDAEASAVNVYRNAFTLADDAVRNRADQFFQSALSSAPQITIGYFDIRDINERRGKINDLFIRWQSNLINASRVDSFILLEQAANDLVYIKSFIDDLSSLVNRQQISSALSQATLDAQKASISLARTNVDMAISNVTAAKDVLTSKSIGAFGSERQSEITAAEASLSAARAALEKTIIRAPLEGTINSISLEAGNFVSLSTPVVTIANNEALEIETFITENDRRDVAVGGDALIAGRYHGTITRIAPALDPITKKIEVRIGIDVMEVPLTNGESVTVSLLREPSRISNSDVEEYLVPISALKVETDRIVVFTVSSDNMLFAHEIVEGPILGDRIVIEEGVVPEMIIVLDARGLHAGDTVDVAQ